MSTMTLNDVTAFGLNEMDANELENTNGGFWPAILIGAAIAVAIVVIDSSQELVQGVKDGYAATQ